MQHCCPHTKLILRHPFAYLLFIMAAQARCLVNLESIKPYFQITITSCYFLVVSSFSLVVNCSSPFHGFFLFGISSFHWNQGSYLNGSNFHGLTWPTKWATTGYRCSTQQSINPLMKGIIVGPLGVYIWEIGVQVVYNSPATFLPF
jgi:hypothetical protein